MSETAVVAIESARGQQSLREIMDFVEATCARFGVNGTDSFDVRLAVEEVCTNIIMYGYQGREPGPLQVSLSDDDDRVVIKVADRASPFDPQNAPSPDLDAPLEDRVAGGLGLHLVREVMDEMHYETSADGTNSLTLVKRKSQ